MQDNGKTSFVKLKTEQKMCWPWSGQLSCQIVPTEVWMWSMKLARRPIWVFSSSAKQYQDKQLIPRCQENKFDHEVQTFYDTCEH